MIAHCLSSLRSGSIPDHGGVFQGIFPWLITDCIDSGSTKKWSGAPWKKAFSLTKSMRCLRISLAYGKQTKTHGPAPKPWLNFRQRHT